MYSTFEKVRKTGVKSNKDIDFNSTPESLCHTWDSGVFFWKKCCLYEI